MSQVPPGIADHSPQTGGGPPQTPKCVVQRVATATVVGLVCRRMPILTAPAQRRGTCNA